MELCDERLRAGQIFFGGVRKLGGAEGRERLRLDPVALLLLQRAARLARFFAPASQPPVIEPERRAGDRIERALIGHPAKQPSCKAKPAFNRTEKHPSEL